MSKMPDLVLDRSFGYAFIQPAQKVPDTDPKRGFTYFFLHVSNDVYANYLHHFQKFGHMGERGGSPENYIHGAGRKSRLRIHEVTNP